mmetsp:Transcript_131561/g.420882  ORF Transcript_131561/g.420882 Transcript_131561/m.420882 type:complete len:251 (+) Transcript_131561:180-932(+)
MHGALLASHAKHGLCGRSPRRLEAARPELGEPLLARYLAEELRVLAGRGERARRHNPRPHQVLTASAQLLEPLLAAALGVGLQGIVGMASEGRRRRQLLRRGRSRGGRHPCRRCRQPRKRRHDRRRGEEGREEERETRQRCLQQCCGAPGGGRRWRRRIHGELQAVKAGKADDGKCLSDGQRHAIGFICTRGVGHAVVETGLATFGVLLNVIVNHVQKGVLHDDARSVQHVGHGDWRTRLNNLAQRPCAM